MTDTDTMTRAKVRFKKKKQEPEKGKREAKRIKPGSLAWEQGRLSSGEVVKYAEPPKYDVKTMVGKYPAGYIDTGDTPRSTIQVIGGPVKRHVDKSSGIVTAHAEPDSRKITFTSNNLGKGEIRIVEETEPQSRQSKRDKDNFRRNGGKFNTRVKNLGAGVVRDRRGQHIKLY